MVLPEPAAHDAHGHAVGWIDEIAVSLGLSEHGSIVLVDQAHPARLGDLVRTLRHKWPDIDVHTDPRELLQLAPGSMFVLVPRAEHADWLNMRRQLFADQRFKVVLWCDEATTVALARNAIDFFDWIAHRQTCPKGPAPFAVSGLRAAFQAKWPVVWTGSDPKEAIEETIRAAAPGKGVSWADGSEAYERLLERMADPAVVAVRIGSARQLRRARWAIAEAKRSSRVILVAPGLDCPGFWPVHARFEGSASARNAFADAGARAPGRLAALLDLEPEAISQVKTLLKTGITGKDAEEAAVEDMDPAAGLVRLLERKGGLDGERPIWRDEDPLMLRTFMNRAKARASFDTWMASITRRSLDGNENTQDIMRDIGVWAAHATWRLDDNWAIVPELRAWTVETALRAGPDNIVSWVALATAAASLGEPQVSSQWLLRIPKNYMGHGTVGLIQHIREEKDPIKCLTRLHELADTFEHAIDQKIRNFHELSRLLWICGLVVLLGGGAICLLISPGWLLLAVVLLGFLLHFSASWYTDRGDAARPLTRHPGNAFLQHEKQRAEEVTSQIQLAAVLLSDENLPEAAAAAQRALANARLHLGADHPLYEKAAQLLVSVLLANGCARDALELLHSLLSPERQTSAELALLSARILASTGRAGDAVQVLARLTGAAISASSLLLPTSAALASSEEPSLDRLLQCPAGTLAQNPDAHLALTEALLKQGRYPEAVLVARKAVATFAKDTAPAVDKLRARLADLERRMGPAGADAAKRVKR
jgi:tetratricopeptide (TPR) repeat protein